jgi:hypothetical protein
LLLTWENSARLRDAITGNVVWRDLKTLNYEFGEMRVLYLAEEGTAPNCNHALIDRYDEILKRIAPEYNSVFVPNLFGISHESRGNHRHSNEIYEILPGYFKYRVGGFTSYDNRFITIPIKSLQQKTVFHEAMHAVQHKLSKSERKILHRYIENHTTDDIDGIITAYSSNIVEKEARAFDQWAVRRMTEKQETGKSAMGPNPILKFFDWAARHCGGSADLMFERIYDGRVGRRKERG